MCLETNETTNKPHYINLNISSGHTKAMTGDLSALWITGNRLYESGNDIKKGGKTAGIDTAYTNRSTIRIGLKKLKSISHEASPWPENL